MMTASGLPALELIARIEVHVGAPLMLGQLNGVERRVVPILGGTVTGPRLQGTVVAGGSDIQIVRPHGVIELVARYTLDLGAAGMVLVENTGIRRPSSNPSDADSRQYFRGVFRFDAPHGSLQWLNENVFVSRGRREGDVVHLDVLQLL